MLRFILKKCQSSNFKLNPKLKCQRFVTIYFLKTNFRNPSLLPFACLWQGKEAKGRKVPIEARFLL